MLLGWTSILSTDPLALDNLTSAESHSLELSVRGIDWNTQVNLMVILEKL